MNKISKFIILLVLSLLTAIVSIELSSKKLNKKAINYITNESKSLIMNIVSNSVNEALEKNITDNLFNITKNDNHEIEVLDYNTKEVNKILRLVNENVQKKLIDLETGKIDDEIIKNLLKRQRYIHGNQGIIYEMPLGLLKSNIFYSNFGPLIPLKINFHSGIISYMNTKITPYGYNSIIIETTIIIEIEEQIETPVTSSVKKLTYNAPLTLKILQGIIPKYYYENGLEKNSSIYLTE